MVTNDLSKTRVKKNAKQTKRKFSMMIGKIDTVSRTQESARTQLKERRKGWWEAHTTTTRKARKHECYNVFSPIEKQARFRDSQDRANSWPIELNRRKVIHPHVYFTHVSTRKWTSEWHFSRQEKSTSSLLGNATSDRTRKDEWNGRVYTLVRHGSLLMEEKSNEIFWTRRNEKKKKKKM